MLGKHLRHAVTVIATIFTLTASTGTPAYAGHTDPGWPSPDGASPWSRSESWYISGSWYGEGYHGEASRDHYAIDFAHPTSPCRRSLYAFWDGMTVSYVDASTGSLHLTKTIDGWRYRVTYLHLDEIWFGVGAMVGTDTVVGLTGTRGNSTGCHLHLSVHRYHPGTGGWHSIEPRFCGRTYPHDHSARFPGCPRRAGR